MNPSRMTTRAHRMGLPSEVIAVGLLFAVVSLEILVTYARLPAGELYHVSGRGLSGGAGRVLVFLNFPTALVAIAILALLADRMRGRFATVVAVLGISLSAAVFWPGVVDQADLDARPVNGLAALGVGLAVVLAALAGPARERLGWRGTEDVLRIAVALAVLVLAVPWLAADLGLSFEGVPVLGTLYQSGELRSQPGVAGLHPAVHHGHHHGMDGALLVLTALLLSRVVPSVRRRWLRAGVGAYLALMLAYGLAEVANDFWLEQVVKRGWTDWAIPDVTRPKISIAWGVVLLGAAALYAASAFRAHRSPANPTFPAVGKGAS
jgi:hypothetical protein